MFSLSLCTRRHYRRDELQAEQGNTRGVRRTANQLIRKDRRTFNKLETYGSEVQ